MPCFMLARGRSFGQQETSNRHDMMAWAGLVRWACGEANGAGGHLASRM